MLTHEEIFDRMSDLTEIRRAGESGPIDLGVLASIINGVDETWSVETVDALGRLSVPRFLSADETTSVIVAPGRFQTVVDGETASYSISPADWGFDDGDPANTLRNLLDMFDNGVDASGDHVVAGGGGDNVATVEGRADGRAGDDWLVIRGDGEAVARGAVYGGPGDDLLTFDGDGGFGHGGRGDDVLEALAGSCRAKGGAGADLFIAGAAADLERIPDEPAPDLWLLVADYTASDDRFVFHDYSGEEWRDGFGEGDYLTLADLLPGAGDAAATLADLPAELSHDGDVFRFKENRKGEAVIQHTGEREDGADFRETVVFKGLGLDDIAASEIEIAPLDELV